LIADPLKQSLFVDSEQSLSALDIQLLPELLQLSIYCRHPPVLVRNEGFDAVGRHAVKVISIATSRHLALQMPSRSSSKTALFGASNNARELINESPYGRSSKKKRSDARAASSKCRLWHA